jgi:hypothetical protein
MSLIEVNADLNRTAKALERLVHLLEMYLAQFCGIVLDPQPASEPRDAKEEVVYATDEDQRRRELEAQLNPREGDEGDDVQPENS